MTLLDVLRGKQDRFTGEWRYTPPSWMRHVTPWRLLRWINDHSDVCWANVVMWKEFPGKDNWWPNRDCFRSYDYCGKFDGKPLPEIPQSALITFTDSASAIRLGKGK